MRKRVNTEPAARQAAAPAARINLRLRLGAWKPRLREFVR